MILTNHIIKRDIPVKKDSTVDLVKEINELKKEIIATRTSKKDSGKLLLKHDLQMGTKNDLLNLGDDTIESIDEI